MLFATTGGGVAMAFALEQLEALLRSLPDPAFVLSASGRYVAVFGGTDARYYHDGSPLVGHTLHEVLVPARADAFLADVHAALRDGGLRIVEYELSNRDVRGLSDHGPSQPIWFEGRITRLPFLVDGEAVVLWVASNVTHRRLLQDQLRSLSETDDLTSLANRRRFAAELQACFEAFVRYGQMAAVLSIDLDRFKAINDELGHACGDDALKAVAAVLSEHRRRTDLAARLGGDEFVLLCPHTALDEACALADRLKEPVNQALALFALPDGGRASVSIGCAVLEPDDQTGYDMLRRADEALYRAKRRGRAAVL